ncbi:hypothetical protein F383_28101 [Gossypium arboreum]|uniref:Uncharacterized protein n=1 Tax=Gossypium arboreum TaxID=29729 RepID=A0A0B0PAY8_GOSAR|nr:hypothetical protein F383_28101 [Gossypium arboreum]
MSTGYQNIICTFSFHLFLAKTYIIIEHLYKTKR